MGLKEDLEVQVYEIFRSKWTSRDGSVVPTGEGDLKLGNDAVTLDATVLYADMAGSTTLVDSYPPLFAAEVYKAFLHIACKVIRSQGGEITAFDGDRVMAVYIGEGKNTNATRTGLMINYAVIKILNPQLRRWYDANHPGQYRYTVQHGVGVDTSSILVAKTGIRNSNDLVWVGRAANHAAKLASIRQNGNQTWISKDVYFGMHESVKFASASRTGMWELCTWNSMNGISVYRSGWTWPI